MYISHIYNILIKEFQYRLKEWVEKEINSNRYSIEKNKEGKIVNTKKICVRK